jgi:SPP1 gp7 family putative phage head morphogenesis protein
MVDMVTQNQVLLERLKAQIVGESNLILKREIDSILSDIAQLRVDDFSSLSKAKLKTFTDRVNAAVSTATTAKNAHVNRYMEVVASDEATFAAESLGATTNLATPQAIGSRAYKAAITDVMSATGVSLPEFMEGWAINQRERVLQTVQRGFKEGWTTSRMMAEFRGTSAGNFKDGLHGKEARNARTVINTATQHVANTAYQDVWKGVGDDTVTGYKWVSTLDQSTSNVCRNLDGEVFEFDKGPVPPIHPNCRSTTIPKLAKDLEYLEEGRTRASADGPTPADQDYYGWLGTQPADFQDKALGKGKGKVFREKGADWFKKNNTTKAGKELTTVELTDTVEKRKASEKKRAETLARNKKAKEADAAKKARDIAAAKKAGEATARRTAAKKKDIADRRAAADALRKKIAAAERKAAREAKKTKKDNESSELKEIQAELAAIEAAPSPTRHIRKGTDGSGERTRIESLSKDIHHHTLVASKHPKGSAEHKFHKDNATRMSAIRTRLYADLKEIERRKPATKSTGKTVLPPMSDFERNEAMHKSIFKKRHNVSLPTPRFISAEDGAVAKAPMQKRAKDAKTLFENSMSAKNVEALNRHGAHKNVAVVAPGRAFYRDSTRAMYVSNSTPTSTMLHEYAHALEYASPEVSNMTKSFLQKRAKSQRIQKLSKLTGQSAYKDTEVAWEDEFKKRGGEHYMGKRYMGKATEILTMGIERLNKSPLEFKQRDPEYFNFMLEVLNR